MQPSNNSPAAFKGTYSDFKLIKTRGVVSISFEVPVEQAQAALDVLGGMPLAATEVWCAVARLQKESEVAPPANSNQQTETLPRQEPSTPDGAKTKFRDMRMPNQAGILCNTEAFQRFVAERVGISDHSDASAVDYVRDYCGVKTRGDIRPRTPSGDRWTKLVDEYRTWMHEVV